MEWLSEVHAGTVGLSHRATWLRIKARAAREMGMTILAEELEDCADGIDAASAHISAAVRAHLSEEVAVGQRQITEVFMAVMEMGGAHVIHD